MDILKNDKINEVLKLLEMKCYKDREIQEITGISKGSLYRIKQGKIKPNRIENTIDFNSIEITKENIKAFINSPFGQLFDKKIRELQKEVKELEKDLFEAESDINELLKLKRINEF